MLIAIGWKGKSSLEISEVFDGRRHDSFYPFLISFQFYMARISANPHTDFSLSFARKFLWR